MSKQAMEKDAVDLMFVFIAEGLRNQVPIIVPSISSACGPALTSWSPSNPCLLEGNVFSRAAYRTES